MKKKNTTFDNGVEVELSFRESFSSQLIDSCVRHSAFFRFGAAIMATVYLNFFLYIKRKKFRMNNTRKEKNMIVAYLQCTHSVNSSNMSDSFDSQSRTLARDSVYRHRSHGSLYFSHSFSLSVSLSSSPSLKIV